MLLEIINFKLLIISYSSHRRLVRIGTSFQWKIENGRRLNCRSGGRRRYATAKWEWREPEKRMKRHQRMRDKSENLRKTTIKRKMGGKKINNRTLCLARDS